MANLHFAEEPAPEQEAIAALVRELASWYSDAFHVRTTSDDGGKILEILLEREAPSEQLEPFLIEALPAHKWMGWRLIIIKCTQNYIELFIHNKKSYDGNW